MLHWKVDPSCSYHLTNNYVHFYSICKFMYLQINVSAVHIFTLLLRLMPIHSVRVSISTHIYTSSCNFSSCLRFALTHISHITFYIHISFVIFSFLLLLSVGYIFIHFFFLIFPATFAVN